MAIIAAYAGTGKTWLANHHPDAVEVLSMPYHWVMPPSVGTPAENEKEKGAIDRIRHPCFPLNMVLEVLEAEMKGKIVIVPTTAEVIHSLCAEYKRNVYIVTPGDDLAEEYLQRYTMRGNTGTFIEIFWDHWAEKLQAIRKIPGTHFSLRKGEYLADIFDSILAEIQGLDPNPVNPQQIEKLQAEIENLKGDCNLVLFGLHPTAYHVEDVTDAKTVDFLCSVGRKAIELDIMKPLFFPRKICNTDPYIRWVQTEEEFLAAMDRSAERDQPATNCASEENSKK